MSDNDKVERAPMPFSAPGESSKLDLTTPRDNLRWALTALDLLANGLRNRRKLGADDVEMLNLKCVIGSVEEALRLIRESPPSSDGASGGMEFETVTVDKAQWEYLNAFKSKIEEAEARCCPEDYGFEEWIGVLTKRDGHLAHGHLQALVGLLLGTRVPIGPMRDRKDYPSELQDAINYLHGRSQPSASSSKLQDIPSIIRRSTWRTPELRESAARLVENILRPEDHPTA